MEISIDEVSADVQGEESAPPPEATTGETGGGADREGGERLRAAREERLRERLRAY
jgi:hypothetical protein